MASEPRPRSLPPTGSSTVAGDERDRALSASVIPRTQRQSLRTPDSTTFEHTAFDLVANVGPDAIVDEDQLVFLGVPEDQLPEAREAVAAHLTQFARPDGRYDAPLAVQIFLAGT